MNTNFDIKLSGPEAAPPSLEIATRVTYALSPTLTVGVESYSGAGELRRLGGLAEQSTFAVVDQRFGRWDLEFGAGAGYGANRDNLILKAVIGVPID